MEFVSSAQPGADEPVCLISYIIASTRVGGGPEERTGFWPAYREALATNEKTDYRNSRVDICEPIIKEVIERNPSLKTGPLYYRRGALVSEKASN